MQENEVRTQEEAQESVTVEAAETPEVRKTGLKDIVTVQAIICVVTGILFVSLNIWSSDLAADIFDFYSEKSAVCGSIMDIVDEFIDFLGSTPNV
ncbi:MAG: hypothetical protein J1F11_03885 [Oscillospiraceae bacterium]|nr:hypothetical protein [Oscillospiraceae bacterium]